MILLGEKLARSFQEAFLGRTFPVLLEERKKLEGTSIWEGLTSNYLRVRAEMGEGYWRGVLVNVRLEESMNGLIKGQFTG